jgi:hypothetical protein
MTAKKYCHIIFWFNKNTWEIFPCNIKLHALGAVLQAGRSRVRVMTTPLNFLLASDSKDGDYVFDSSSQETVAGLSCPKNETIIEDMTKKVLELSM